MGTGLKPSLHWQIDILKMSVIVTCASYVSYYLGSLGTATVVILMSMESRQVKLCCWILVIQPKVSNLTIMERKQL